MKSATKRLLKRRATIYTKRAESLKRLLCHHYSRLYNQAGYRLPMMGATWTHQEEQLEKSIRSCLVVAKRLREVTEEPEWEKDVPDYFGKQ